MSMMTIFVSGSPMHRLSVSRALASAAAAWIVVVPLWAGATTPGYSHIASYISELGALLGIGTSYIGAALARCDPGCPATGSSRQTVHNLLGLLEYGGGGIGLWFLARPPVGGPQGGWVRAGLRGAGAVAIVALVLMGVPELAQHRGLAQRVADAALFSSLLLIGWRVAALEPTGPRSGG